MGQRLLVPVKVGADVLLTYFFCFYFIKKYYHKKAFLSISWRAVTLEVWNYFADLNIHTKDYQEASG